MSTKGTFRWNVTRREQLGRLVEGRVVDSYDGYLDDLVVCCGRVLSLCDDSDLLFLGRSPESLFDFLSGALEATSWSERLRLLNLSNRDEDTAEIRDRNPGRVEALRAQLEAQGLSPIGVIRNPRTVALVDLVHSGGTLGNIIDFWTTWARECGDDVTALRSKFRFVGVTSRKKSSPNTWRWQQQVNWMQDFPQRVARNVSVPVQFWRYLGNTQKKTVPTYPSWRWGDPEHQSPNYWGDRLDALALAVQTYESGRSRAWRQTLVSELARHAQIREQWLRDLMQEVRDGR